MESELNRVKCRTQPSWVGLSSCERERADGAGSRSRSNLRGEHGVNFRWIGLSSCERERADGEGSRSRSNLRGEHGVSFRWIGLSSCERERADGAGSRSRSNLRGEPRGRSGGRQSFGQRTGFPAHLMARANRVRSMTQPC